jgi:hypothetical protein
VVRRYDSSYDYHHYYYSARSGPWWSVFYGLYMVLYCFIMFYIDFLFYIVFVLFLYCFYFLYGSSYDLILFPFVLYRC